MPRIKQEKNTYIKNEATRLAARLSFIIQLENAFIVRENTPQAKKETKQTMRSEERRGLTKRLL